MLSVFTGYFIELMLLFMFVFAHECGHMLMARQLNWNIKELKLLPFGGVLIIDDAQATKAKDEILVALAGPLQNVILIALIWLSGQFHFLSFEWVNYMIMANSWLILFNLLPISPLDGGKLVQAFLSLLLPYYTTLKIVTWTSIVGGGLMILFAMTYSLWFAGSGPQLNLLLIGSFILVDNIMRLKHLPYLLYRFILQRDKQLKQLTSENAVPVVVHETDSLFSLFKKIRRESSHLFYCVSTKSKQMKMKTEYEIVQNFIQSSHLNRALIDIFD